MTTYTVKMEGRSNIPVPEDIAKDEQKLRRALSAVINGVADAEIKYHEEKDGVVEIEVVKKAGTKGNYASVSQNQFGSQDLILKELQRRKGGRNPAIKAFLELRALDTKTLDPVHMLDIGVQIDRVMAEGEKQGAMMRATFQILMQAQPVVSSFIVLGL